MRLFLATTSLDDIRWGADAGLIDGVVATPTVIASEAPQADSREIVADIMRATRLPVCASVPAVTSADLAKGARELAKLGEHVIVAVPLIEDALPAVRRLAGDGIAVAATLVHSVAQGILAAHAGATMVTVSVDALDAVGEDGARVVALLRQAFDRTDEECDVAAAGPASAGSFAACAAAGADVAIVTPAVLRALLQHPLTDRGLDRFLGAISRRPKPKRAR
jgi:transaldolase